MNPNTLKLNWTTCKYHQNQKNENIPYLRPSLHLHSWSFPVQLPDKLNKVLSTLNLLQYWTNLLSWEKVCAVLYIPYLLLVWWLIHWLLIQAWQPTKQCFQVNYRKIPNISPLGACTWKIALKYTVKQSKNGKFTSNYKAGPIDFEMQISFRR